MIKAELSYNPYLLETKAKFNGRNPRVNSLIKKYEGKIIQDWINELPKVFHDEMNGYDFELEFYGTELDYEDVCKSFLRENVSTERVKVFHVGTISDRKQKNDEIDSLLYWLKNNPGYINYDELLIENDELLDAPYPFVVIKSSNEEGITLDWIDAGVEIITDIDELTNTYLKHTPILICIDYDILDNLQIIIRKLIKRSDVCIQQIFFLVSDIFEKDTIARTIKDYGIKEPHFVESINDKRIQRFCDVYPISDFIRDVARLMEEETKAADEKVLQVIVAGEETNSEVNKYIEKLDKDISYLKEIDNEMQRVSKVDYTSRFEIYKNEFFKTIEEWCKKKTKIVGASNAAIIAKDFETEIKANFSRFKGFVIKEMENQQVLIDKELYEKYKNVETEDEMGMLEVNMDKLSEYALPALKKGFLEAKHTTYVKPKEDSLFFARFSDPHEEPIEVSIYYNQEWRSYTIGVLIPIVTQMFNDANCILNKYENDLANSYHKRMQRLIKNKNIEKNAATEKLSNEEKQLQMDIGWLTELKERLSMIERG